ncbi:GtrA family protein [Mordavella massiliensis]|uniref:GtrA family protein n=1 Tax=Mordavella massiliensis TaxID=1871024 RepID=UPI0021094AAF|nr:GtrA family protein [Mordavella massiliensis]
MNKIKKWLDIRFLKFMVVGVVNTVVGTAVMFVMYNVFHQSYWISSASNYVVGSILSYFLNKYFTFESKKKSLSQVLKFVLNISLCYLVAYGIAKPTVTWMLQGQQGALRDNLAMVVGMVLFTLLNYIGQRAYVFKTN